MSQFSKHHGLLGQQSLRLYFFQGRYMYMRCKVENPFLYLRTQVLNMQCPAKVKTPQLVLFPLNGLLVASTAIC